MRSLFDFLQQSIGIRIEFKQNVNDIRYGYEEETVFYRICQEALLNACKYAECEHIKVSLFQTQGFLILEVTDDGKGFDPDRIEIKGSGMGLLGMAERAELIDAELTVQSAPGKGTSVWLAARVKERL